MYNSTNLPLNKKKVLKKTLEKIPLFLVLLVAFGAFAVTVPLTLEINPWPWITLFLILFALAIFGTYWYQVLYYKSYYYDFREDSAEIAKGVITRATGHVRYAKIQNIFIDQDIWDRVLGLYDVHYETAGETSGIYSHIDGLNKENADKLTAFLQNRLDRPGEKVVMPAQAVEKMQVNESSIDTGQEINRENTPMSKRIIIKNTIISSLSSILLAIYIAMEMTSFGALQKIVLGVFLLVIFFLGSFVFNKIWFKNLYFQFSDKSGVVRSRVIAQKESYVYYDRIQNINVNQDILERFFSLYSVIIETAGESGNKKENLGINLPGFKKAEAEKVKQFLLERVSLSKNNI